MTQIIHKAIKKLEKILKIKTPGEYHSLTPTTDCDHDNVYSDAIMWALKQDDIKNIAVSGAYGSGKSSVLQKFQKEHPEYRYVYVSLACFKNETPNIQLVELSILQQLSYSVKHKSMPDSRISRIIRFSNIKLWVFTILSFIFLSCLFIIFFDNISIIDNLKDFLSGLPHVNNNLYIFKFLMYSFVTVFTLYVLKNFIRVISGLTVDKFKLHGGEIELSKTVKPSILNKYLDEILYFFEVNKFDVVIIEDLDRFTCAENNTNIFSKLREINLIINNSQQVVHKVVFIYAVKDDLFTNLHKDRTKFFDFVIPIVPVTNVFNSGDLLLNSIKRVDPTISDEFENLILDISLFLDDMRLVNNIFNEYLIYRNVLSNNPDLIRIFSIIVYKNLMPDDFANLHINEGIVYKLFSNAKYLNKDEIDKLELQVKISKEKINAIETSALENITELRSVYIQKIVETYPQAQSLVINNEEVSFVNAKTDLWFKKIIAGTYSYRYSNTYGSFTTSGAINFSEIEKAVSKSSYQEREEIIKLRENKNLQKIKNDIQKLEKDLAESNKKTIAEFNLNSDHSFFQEIEAFPALIYLIRKGYINEDYHRYISFIYEGKLSLTDHEFLASLKVGKSKPYDFKLIKIENVVKQIRFNEYDFEGSLNITLIDYLLSLNDKYFVEISKITNQIKNDYNTKIDFIELYLLYGEQKKKFINILCEQWEDIWINLYIDIELSEQRSLDLAMNLMNFASTDNLKLINKDSILSEYLEEHPEILELSLKFGLNNKMKNIIRELKLIFKELDNSSNVELINYIYKNNFYEINEVMLSYFISNYYGDIKDSSIDNHPSYTNISNMRDEHLCKYITKNLELYITNIYLKSCNWIEEDQHIEFFLNADIEFNLKVDIIDKMLNTLSDISKISLLELIEKIIENNKCVANWNNVLFYYSEKNKVIDDNLNNYLNTETNYLQLSKTKCNYNEKYDKAFIKDFSISLLLENRISLEAYKKLLKSIIFKYDRLNIEGLNDDKVYYLIDSEVLTLTADNFKSLVSNYNSFIRLAVRDKRTFLRNYTKFDIDLKGLKYLLKTNSLTQKQKGRILKQTDLSQLNDKDLGTLISEYFVKENIIVDFSQLIAVLKNCENNKSKKLIIIQHIEKNTFSKSEINSIIKLLGPDYYKVGKPRQRPKLKSNILDKSLLEALKKLKYIKEYDDDGKIIKIKNWFG